MPTPSLLPDFVSDLNAMHKVEKTLSPSELIRYKLELVRFSSGENTLAIVATASQRAEAYLRTINKWVAGGVQMSVNCLDCQRLYNTHEAHNQARQGTDGRDVAGGWSR